MHLANQTLFYFQIWKFEFSGVVVSWYPIGKGMTGDDNYFDFYYIVGNCIQWIQCLLKEVQYNLYLETIQGKS